jgi:acyl carrier protein
MSSMQIIEAAQIEAKIIALVGNMSQDQDMELDEQIDSDTTLVADLDFGSMDFIKLVLALEDEFKQKLGFHDLLMSQGQYVEDLTIGALVSFVEQKLNSGTGIPAVNYQVIAAKTSTEETFAKIDDSKVARFRETINGRIAELESFSEEQVLPYEHNKEKNKQAIFILSPPRSGSTLLRIILAGHPKLFAPPELHLLTYANLNQRKLALGGNVSIHLLQGAIRAIMQLENCSAEEAEILMQNCESQGFTTKEFYHWIQQKLADKILVDKTPTYASHVNILRRAEIEFENPLYIHLVRHPYGMIRSYETSKLERVVPIMNQRSLTRREISELTWLISHENILEFFQDIPENRKLTLKFEDLVADPESSIRNQCQFLGLEFEPEMLNVYNEKQQRMTDGVRQASEMSGDLKFHLHTGIEPNVANSWKRDQITDYLADRTWKVANFLGYAQDD